MHLGTPSTSGMPSSTSSPHVNLTCVERHTSVLPPPPTMPFDLVRPSTSACPPAPIPPPLPIRGVPYFLPSAPPPPLPVGFPRVVPHGVHLPFSALPLNPPPLCSPEPVVPPLPSEKGLSRWNDFLLFHFFGYFTSYLSLKHKDVFLLFQLLKSIF